MPNFHLLPKVHQIEIKIVYRNRRRRDCIPKEEEEEEVLKIKEGKEYPYKTRLINKEKYFKI